ncbi:MAG: hypothetical protein ACK47J_12050 [Pseudanabaena sp.]
MSTTEGWGWWPYRVVDWRGLRVYYSREDNSPCFEPIFRPVLKRLRGYSWLIERDTFDRSRMSDAECEATELLFGDQPLALVEDDRFLETKGTLFADDWNRLFGFSSPVTVPRPFWNQDGILSPHILKTVDVLFDNWDGAYWACYSRHTDIVNEILGMIHTGTQMRVVPCTFDETLLLHKREWEVWQAENVMRKDDVIHPPT